MGVLLNIFREIHELSADLDVLTQLLNERYSNDPDVRKWIAKYSGIYYGRIQQYLMGILKCALRLEFIHKNFTVLKQAFQELG